MIVLLIVSCLVILVLGSRASWQRKHCPACRSAIPARAQACAYCTREVPV